jgi:hypothetical protein
MVFGLKKWLVPETCPRSQRAFHMGTNARKLRPVDLRIIFIITHVIQTLKWISNHHEESLAELRLVASQIADKRMPLRGLAESLHMGTTRSRRQFQQFGIPFVTSPGRLPGFDVEEIQCLIQTSCSPGN